VHLRFTLKDATSGEPLRGRAPAAWMDAGDAEPGDGERTCKEKIPLYLRGLVGLRPLVDLNSYYLLVLNQDPSISVVDPLVGMTGKTSLYATILLPSPGADWAKGRDERRFFVSMPRARQVAVVDAQRFRVEARIDAGEAPNRVAVQPDGRYVWVGDDARGGPGGVTVIDAETLKVAARIRTGRGHHEIAFSGDDRRAFVTNRADGTVSVIDVARLAKLKDVRTGGVPISIATSPLSGAVHVADGKSGRITVLDPGTGEPRATIEARPGLGPMRFSPDGRWGFVVNPAERAVHVVDAADHRLAHTLAVGGEPYQVTFTRAYAYLRLLDSERVAMVKLSSLGGEDPPIVQGFPAGARAPKLVPELGIADVLAPSTTDAGMFVLSPGDNATYFYMEGMNAPMGSFGSYGHVGRAIALADRSLREVEPGVYAGPVRIPAAGRYDVAFLLDAPRVVHCFSLEARPNPLLRRDGARVDVEHLDLPLRIAAGTAQPVRFRLLDPVTSKPAKGLTDVRVVYAAAPTGTRREAPAREVSEGLYEATPAFDDPGSYYLHVAIPSLQVRPGDVPYRSLRVVPAGPPTRTAGSAPASPGAAR
jgi:YVTN family beta-propeller protein